MENPIRRERVLYTGVHIERGRDGKATTDTHWLSPFRRLDEGCIFKRERSPTRPVNLSLALLLGPFRSSQNGSPPSAPRLAWCGWLADWLVGGVSGGRSVLGALDLSAGLLWGMLTCPKDAVLRSTLL